MKIKKIPKEYKGDLLKELNEGDVDMIVHGANCFNKMGAGIAAQIKNSLPSAFIADMEFPIKIGDINRLGNISFSNTVINLYSQYHPGPNADIDAIRIGLRKINETMKVFNYTIGLPLIGCGIGGLKWRHVKQVIIEELKDIKFVIVHFDDKYLIPKTKKDFNTKWSNHIEKGFEDQGLLISDINIIEYLDKKFTELLTEFPSFEYSQIKYKFDYVQCYINHVSYNKINEIKYKLDDINRKK